MSRFGVEVSRPGLRSVAVDGHVERQFMFERPPGFKQKIAGALWPLATHPTPPGPVGVEEALSGGRSEFILPRSISYCVKAPVPSPQLDSLTSRLNIQQKGGNGLEQATPLGDFFSRDERERREESVG